MEFNWLSTQNHTQSLHKIYKTFFDKGEPPIGGNWTYESLKCEVESGTVLGAFYQSEMMGFLLFSARSNFCDLLLLGVSTQHRKKGIMSQLLRHFVKHQPFEKYFVEVHEKNLPALNFYQSFGFKEVGFRKDFYGLGESAKLLAFEK